MTIAVSKKGVQVKANGKYHKLDDFIHGLPDSEEKRLVEEGICACVPSSNFPPDHALDTKEAEDVKVPESNKASGSKRVKNVDPSSDQEAGPDTSHPLV